MVFTLGVVFFFFGGSEPTLVDEPSTVQEESESNELVVENAKNASDKTLLAEADKKSTSNTKNQNTQTNVDQRASSSSYSASYNDTNTSYPQDNDNYGTSSGGSYWQDNATYGNTSSVTSQSNSSYGNTGSSSNINKSSSSSSQSNSSNSKDNNRSSDTAESETKKETLTEQDLEGMKYQRVYDNGIAWYGDTGSLMVEYQSSNPETTGIGFRLHYDSTAMRVISVNQYPVDAITSTSPGSSNTDAANQDNDPATDAFLPFAWASIYGQWPQMNQATLATVEFEKIYGSSTNYYVNYTPISVSAGYQFVQ
jgi:hypothetical protein